MRELAIERMQSLFGAPTSSCDYLFRWNLTPTYDVLIERQGGPEGRAVIWTPWLDPSAPAPALAETYRANESRRDNTYSLAPSLERGRAALKYLAYNREDLDAVFDRVVAESRCDGSNGVSAKLFPSAAAAAATSPAGASGSLFIPAPTNGKAAQTVADIHAIRRSVIIENQHLPIETLHARVKRGDLDPQPDYQREWVWERDTASRLIESVLLGMPIPEIYVAVEEDNRQSVIDGQQRIRSIVGFIDGIYPERGGGDFRLTRLHVLRQYNNHTFKDLPKQLQHCLMSTALRLVVVKEGSDPQVKYELFDRLNSGAKGLNHQELRNAMYYGSYNEVLKDLAKHPLMLKIRRKTEPDRRMKDRELILRFFAFWRATPGAYRSNMKRFLNQEMESHRNADDRELNRMRSQFERALDMAWTVFGENAGRRFMPGADDKHDGHWDTSKINASVWDTIMHCFSLFDKSQIVPIADQILEEFLNLVATDPLFAKFVSTGTDSASRVRWRMVASVQLRRWPARRRADWAGPEDTGHEKNDSHIHPCSR